jgi:MFS transporter, DHA2 family, glioxin efflux transporter
MPDVGQPYPPMTDDQYPHGLKLILLAGSSLIAVFLIALDQVRCYLFPGLR